MTLTMDHDETEHTWELVITLPEVLAVMTLTRTHFWPGVPEFSKQSPDEIELLTEHGFKSLIQKNIIYLNEQGIPFLHSTVNYLLNTVKFPHKFFSLMSTNGTRLLFVTPESILEQELTAGGEICWRVLQNLDLLFGRAQEFLGINCSSHSDGSRYEILNSTIDQTRQTKVEALIDDELSGKQISGQLASQIKEMILTEKTPNGVIEHNSINPAEIVSQIIWLSTNEGLWLVGQTPAGREQSNLVLESIPSDILQKRVAEILQM